MSHDSDPHLDRLADAVEVFLDIRADPSGSSLERHLAENEDVRDLLEPMLDDRPGDAQPGHPDARRLGDYSLLREIGRGGMGVVFEAEETSLGRRVALKVLAPHLTQSERQVERFRREAAAAAKLIHPSIVPVHAVGEEDGNHFIAMELVRGQSLRRLIDEVAERCQDDPLPLVSAHLGHGTAAYFDQVAELTAQVAEALAFSHERGVLHRDIKPQNLIVNDEGRVCLVDFGLAKDLETQSLSLTGEFAGTPEYVSPEQAGAGNGRLNGKTDVFSVGVILYELLTLKLPFHGATTRHVLDAVMRTEPRSPRARCSVVPHDLDTLCQHALDKDPEGRMSAAALAEDLRRYQRREPISVRPVGPMTRALRYVRRNKAVAAAGVLGFILLFLTPLAGAIFFKVSADRLREEQARTERQMHLAQENLTMARGAVNQMLVQIGVHGLHRIPHAKELRDELLTQAEDYYSTLIQAGNESLVLQNDHARAVGGLALVAFQRGHIDQALEGYGQSIALLESRRHQFDQDTRAYQDLAAMYQHRARCLLSRRRLNEAAEDAARSRELLLTVLGLELDDSFRGTVEVNLAFTDDTAAAIAYSRGQIDALDSIERSVETWQRLADASPNTPLFKVQGLAARARHGRMLAATPRVEEGRALLGELIPELRRKMADNPGNIEYRWILAEALLGQYTVRSRIGPESQLDAIVSEAQSLFHGLSSEFPSDPYFRTASLGADLVLAKRLLSTLDTTRFPELLERLPRLVARGEANAALDSAMPQDLLSLGMARSMNGLLEGFRSDQDSSLILQLHNDAIENLRAVVAEGDTPSFRIELGAALNNFALYLVQPHVARFSEATTLIEEAIALQKDVLEQRGSNNKSRSYLTSHLRNLCDIGQRTKDLDSIESAARELVAAAPDHPALLAEAAGHLARGIPLILQSDRPRAEALTGQLCGWLRRAVRKGLNAPSTVLAAPMFQQLAELEPMAELLADLGEL